MTDIEQRNGWNVAEFNETVEAVRQQPEAGRLKFKARFAWDEAFGGDGRTESIEQLGQTIPRKFTLRGDHPPELLGSNTGPTAVETLLCALASCIGGTYAAHATARGVEIDDLEVELESGIDLNGFLQLADIPAGLDGVRVHVRVRSSADDDQLEEILRATRSASPVFDSITRPIPVQPVLRRM